MSDTAELNALYDVVERAAGRIDVLVANADGGAIAPLGEITAKHFDSTFAFKGRAMVFRRHRRALHLVPQGASVALIGFLDVAATQRGARGLRCEPSGPQALRAQDAGERLPRQRARHAQI